MDQTKKNTFDWLEIAQKLQAIAQAGLEFGHNQFDVDRYEQIRNISIDIMEHYTESGKEKIRKLFASEKGYPTPKVDIRAAIFQDNKILMVKEKMDGRWSLPGGWADQDLTISENLIKEAMEEAGAKIQPLQVLAIHDRKIHNSPPIPYGCYKIFVHCEFQGGDFSENTETSDAGFFEIENLPPLSMERNTLEQIKTCFQQKNLKNSIPFD